MPITQLTAHQIDQLNQDGALNQQVQLGTKYSEMQAAILGYVSADEEQTLTLKTLTTPVIASMYQDAGKTKLMTVPNVASDTLAVLGAAQTLALKTLTTPVVASMYQDAGKTKLMTVPDTASDTLAAIAATQTLTNKTLTTPVVASVYQDAGKTKLLTVPDTTSDTLAAISATQTFTNKTVDSASNTLKNVVQAYAGNITRAEMITGKTLVADKAAVAIKVLSVKLTVNGAFSGGAGTSFVLQDSNSSPVAILTSLKAALTAGAKISTEGLAISNVTEGAGLFAALTSGKGIAVAADAAWNAGTSIDIVIQYMYV